MNLTWFQEFKQIPHAAKAFLFNADVLRFPQPHLMDKDSLIEAFLDNLKLISCEYIGRNGQPGQGWPPLASHDENHTFLGAPSGCRARTHDSTLTAHARACPHRSHLLSLPWPARSDGRCNEG